MVDTIRDSVVDSGRYSVLYSVFDSVRDSIVVSVFDSSARSVWESGLSTFDFKIAISEFGPSVKGLRSTVSQERFGKKKRPKRGRHNDQNSMFLGGVGHEDVNDGEDDKSGCRSGQKLPSPKRLQWARRINGNFRCSRVTDNAHVYANVPGGGDQ